MLCSRMHAECAMHHTAQRSGTSDDSVLCQGRSTRGVLLSTLQLRIGSQPGGIRSRSLHIICWEWPLLKLCHMRRMARKRVKRCSSTFPQRSALQRQRRLVSRTSVPLACIVLSRRQAPARYMGLACISRRYRLWEQDVSGKQYHWCGSGVEHLLRDVKDSTVSTLATEVGRMITGLKGLKTRLLDIQQYLQLVLSGKLPVNHDIMYQLQVCSMACYPHRMKRCPSLLTRSSYAGCMTLLLYRKGLPCRTCSTFCQI